MYATLKSSIDTNSAEFKQRYHDFKILIDDLGAKLHSPNKRESTLYQGSKKHLSMHESRDQILARDRVEMTLDEDSPFLELMPLAGYGQEGMTVGASLVAGIGLVA
jgi:acetyl-CoA carboxylase carboxyltransferase component